MSRRGEQSSASNADHTAEQRLWPTPGRASSVGLRDTTRRPRSTERVLGLERQLGPDRPLGPDRLEEWIDPARAPSDHFAAGFPAVCPLEPDLVLLDLETTGLSAGDMAFVAGLAIPSDGGLTLHQELAWDLPGERRLLQRVSDRLSTRPRLVTYNGRSFDVPFLRRRLAWHALPPLPDDLEHLDLLIAVRRRFGDELPDCRLATVERLLLGKRRDGPDIPGAEVPALFRYCVEQRRPELLVPVIRHNRVDLTSLAALLVLYDWV